MRALLSRAGGEKTVFSLRCYPNFAFLLSASGSTGLVGFFPSFSAFLGAMIDQRRRGVWKRCESAAAAMVESVLV
jgi:hypothetical protein